MLRLFMSPSRYFFVFFLWLEVTRAILLVNIFEILIFDESFEAYANRLHIEMSFISRAENVKSEPADVRSRRSTSA